MVVAPVSINSDTLLDSGDLNAQYSEFILIDTNENRSPYSVHQQTYIHVFSTLKSDPKI